MKRSILSLKSFSNCVLITTFDATGYQNMTSIRRTNINNISQNDEASPTFISTNAGTTFEVDEVMLDGKTLKFGSASERMGFISEMAYSNNGLAPRLPAKEGIKICAPFERNMPKRGTEGAGAYDCFAVYPDVEDESYYRNGLMYKPDIGRLTVAPGATITLSLGFSLALPNQNVVAKLMPRSGLGRAGLVLGNLTGVIDSDYRGEVAVVLWNRNRDTDISIDLKKAVCQMTFETVRTDELQQVTEEEFSLLTTVRGTGGFGHSDQSGN